MVDLTIDYVEKLATRFLPLETWGFVESVRTESMLTYSSQWCRLRFDIIVDWHSKYFFISYGRLHASDDKSIIKWRGEDCYCWHNGGDLRILLQYLEGLTPEEAYKTASEPLKEFSNSVTSELTSHPELNSLERDCILHAVIWEHYGLRFFELFDLRRHDLWDAYLDFLKEYYRLHEEKLQAGYAHRGIKMPPATHLPSYKRC